MANNTYGPDKTGQVKKGAEDKSVAHDKNEKKDRAYPEQEKEDKQFDNQPEFIDNRSSRKDEEEI